MKIDLSNKVAFVTGGTKGIGKAIVELLALYGANVGIIARGEKELNEMEQNINGKNEGRILAIKGDVSNAKDVEKAINMTVEHFGGLHLAVNNAGIAGKSGLLHETTIENWENVLGVNLNGIFYAMKYEITEMLKSGGGSIVNIGSIEGHTILRKNHTYTTSKHAIAGLTKTAARDYSDKNIRVNTVSPGVIRIPLVEAPEQKEITDKLEATIPLGRLGEPDEIANTVVFLLSDLSSYTTGVDFVVDGAFLLRGE